MGSVENDGENLAGFRWGVKSMYSREKNYQYYKSFFWEGLEYMLYEDVYMNAEEGPPPIAKIMTLYENLATKERRMLVRWFLRPCELPEFLPGADYSDNCKEIFLACGGVYGRIKTWNSPAAIKSKCQVVCTAEAGWNRAPSEKEVDSCDHYFYRAFDMDTLQLLSNLEELAEELGESVLGNSTPGGIARSGEEEKSKSLVDDNMSKSRIKGKERADVSSVGSIKKPRFNAAKVVDRPPKTSANTVTEHGPSLPVKKSTEPLVNGGSSKKGPSPSTSIDTAKGGFKRKGTTQGSVSEATKCVESAEALSPRSNKVDDSTGPEEQKAVQFRGSGSKKNDEVDGKTVPVSKDPRPSVANSSKVPAEFTHSKPPLKPKLNSSKNPTSSQGGKRSRDGSKVKERLAESGDEREHKKPKISKTERATSASGLDGAEQKKSEPSKDRVVLPSPSSDEGQQRKPVNTKDRVVVLSSDEGEREASRLKTTKDRVLSVSSTEEEEHKRPKTTTSERAVHSSSEEGEYKSRKSSPTPTPKAAPSAGTKLSGARNKNPLPSAKMKVPSSDRKVVDEQHNARASGSKDRQSGHGRPSSGFKRDSAAVSPRLPKLQKDMSTVSDLRKAGASRSEKPPTSSSREQEPQKQKQQSSNPETFELHALDTSIRLGSDSASRKVVGSLQDHDGLASTSVARREEKKSYFKPFSWEDDLENALQSSRVLHLKNLDPFWSSSDLEEVLKEAVQAMKVRVLIPNSYPHVSSVEAYAIFRTSKLAEEALQKMEENFLLLSDDDRPVDVSFVSRGANLASKYSYFQGFLNLDRINIRSVIGEEQTKAVATSHCSQPNTIEYEMGLKWRLLQEQHRQQWVHLQKEHDQDHSKLLDKYNIKR